MALFSECTDSYAQKLLDTADIVREAMLRQPSTKVSGSLTISFLLMPGEETIVGQMNSDASIGRLVLALVSGVAIGALGGLIGLGGAEFRLPLLIGLFGFAALPSVILNKAMSLVVVASALLFRTKVVPFDVVLTHWPIIVNLLAGSLPGAWLGADSATKMRSQTLYRVLAVLLIFIAAVLLLGHSLSSTPPVTGWGRTIAGLVAGFGIGLVAAFMGVAGGELLIPTLILLFGTDIKLAGSLSLAVSLPTMVVGFTRYSRDDSFVVLRQNKILVLIMATGSLVGAWIGGHLLGVVPSAVLLPLLAAILAISAFKVWQHK
jgi:uncharacterized protein